MNSLLATTILILVAHGDDAAVSANYLGAVCADPSTTCVAAVATDGSSVGDPGAFESINSRYLPLHLSDLPGDTPQSQVITQWDADVVQYGYAGFQDGMVDLISRIDPDKVIVLDPRHGTGGHTSHLTLGWHSIAAADRAGYADTVWVQSAKRHIADSHFNGTGFPIDRGEDWSGFTACTPDENAHTVMDGWLNTYAFMRHYPALFDAEKILKAPPEWRQSVLLKWSEQDPADSSYEACMMVWR